MVYGGPMKRGDESCVFEEKKIKNVCERERERERDHGCHEVRLMRQVIRWVPSS